MPPEARSPKENRLAFNRRRRSDPLGEGHASTWRTRLIKVGARIVVTARRVRVLLSAAWPFWDRLAKVTAAIQALSPAPSALDSG